MWPGLVPSDDVDESVAEVVVVDRLKANGDEIFERPDSFKWPTMTGLLLLLF